MALSRRADDALLAELLALGDAQRDSDAIHAVKLAIAGAQQFTEPQPVDVLDAIRAGIQRIRDAYTNSHVHFFSDPVDQRNIFTIWSERVAGRECVGDQCPAVARARRDGAW